MKVGSWPVGADATTRATAIWKQALAEYEAPEMDPAVREALNAYVVQRRAEIGSDDPSHRAGQGSTWTWSSVWATAEKVRSIARRDTAACSG
jgi:hypothetical protein